jgi:D-alanyl-D-alanine carboxypeptidase
LTSKLRKDGEDCSRQLEALVNRLAAVRQVKHAILGVESGDGQFRWTGAAGNATPSGTPMRPDTPFFIASVDKLFKAALILKCHEDGSIGLDAPIATYLPPELAGGLHRLGGVDHTGSITVRHLLGHTSGLPDYLEERPKGGRSLVERVDEEGDLAWSTDESLRLARDWLTPHFPPQPAGARRQRARYSDTNYLLLTAILEAVTGRPLHREYEDVLFRPLKMRHTYLPGHSQPLEPVPEPATLWFGDRPMEIPMVMRSIHGVYSTAGDLLGFLRALVRGEIFRRPGTLALMRQHWNRFGFPLDAAALRAPSWPMEYGLGMMRFRLPRVLTPFHAVPEIVGHSGSTGSWLFHCPKLDLLLAGTVDQVTGGAIPYRFLPKVLRVFDR